MNFIFNGTVKDIELFSAFINSIKEFPVTKALIYVDNQTDKDVQSVLTLSAPNWNIEYSETLNRSQEDWQNLYEKLDSEFVWICSKYDHHFVDTNIQHLNDVLQFRRDAGTEKLASICLSNWLDSLIKCVIIDHGIWDGEKHPAPTQAWITVDECDSFQIATKTLVQSWFFDQDFGRVKFTSLEELSYKIDLIRPWKVQVSSREFMRNANNINPQHDFYDDNLPADERKQKFNAYYYSRISPQQAYLANPNFDAGIYNRILRHYQL